MKNSNYIESQKIMKSCVFGKNDNADFLNVKNLLEVSKSKKTDKFKISSKYNIPCGDWNFQIITEQGEYYIDSCESTGTINNLWGFIEALANGEKKLIFLQTKRDLKLV
jgi:hypothetical protein